MRRRYKIFKSSFLLSEEGNLDVYKAFFNLIAEYHDVSIDVCVRTLLCSHVFVTFASQNFVAKYGVDYAFKRYKSQIGNFNYNFPASHYSAKQAYKRDFRTDEMILYAIHSPAERDVLDILFYLKSYINGGANNDYKNFTQFCKEG